MRASIKFVLNVFLWALAILGCACLLTAIVLACELFFTYLGYKGVFIGLMMLGCLILLGVVFATAKPILK